MFTNDQIQQLKALLNEQKEEIYKDIHKDIHASEMRIRIYVRKEIRKEIKASEKRIIDRLETEVKDLVALISPLMEGQDNLQIRVERLEKEMQMVALT